VEIGDRRNVIEQPQTVSCPFTQKNEHQYKSENGKQTIQSPHKNQNQIQPTNKQRIHNNTMTVSPLIVHKAASLQQVVSMAATSATLTKATMQETSFFASPISVTFFVPLEVDGHSLLSKDKNLPLSMENIDANSTTPPAITRATSGGEATIDEFLSDVNRHIRQIHRTLQQPPLYEQRKVLNAPPSRDSPATGKFSKFQWDMLTSLTWTQY
jgi:hypothetical protein